MLMYPAKMMSVISGESPASMSNDSNVPFSMLKALEKSIMSDTCSSKSSKKPVSLMNLLTILSQFTSISTRRFFMIFPSLKKKRNQKSLIINECHYLAISPKEWQNSCVSKLLDFQHCKTLSRFEVWLKQSELSCVVTSFIFLEQRENI